MKTVVARYAHNLTHATLVAQHDLLACQVLIDYKFTNPGLLLEALQAPGTYGLSATGHFLQRGNENLAIVGDLAHAAVLSAEWHRSAGNKEKGHWQQQWRDRLLSDKNLANISRSSGLNNFLQKKPELRFVEPEQKQAASLFEAVAGAIYLDDSEDAGALRDFVRLMGLLE